MHVPARNEDWAITSNGDTKYTVFATNRSGMTPADTLGSIGRCSQRRYVEIKHRMVKPLMPSIASKDYRMRYFCFVFRCLLYNLWRLVDHSLKQVAMNEYDDYGRESLEKRSPPVVPLSDLLLSSFVIIFREDGLDPPNLA